jgi:hypothetical protein
MNKDEEKMAFSIRLLEICKEMGLPVLNKGLQQELARIFNVRYQSTQKWLDGTACDRLIHVTHPCPLSRVFFWFAKKLQLHRLLTDYSLLL